MSENMQAAYVLHARDYRDTSQILELLTREEGRFGVVVRGARGARSRLRGRLQPFTPLLIAARGRGELRTATSVDFNGPNRQPAGDQLLLGLYVNELLYRLLGRFDPIPRLFDGYEQLLISLQDSTDSLLAVRAFELMLLNELGYGISFDYDAGRGVAIDAEAGYRYMVHEGFFETDQAGRDIYPGRELLAINSGDLGSVDEQRLKLLTRISLAELLGDKPLKSRSLFPGGR